MDPLSITTAAVSFLTFSGASAKVVRRLIHNATHAPKEILSVSNQICDLNVVVADLEAASLSMAQSPNPSQLPRDFGARLEEHLQKARDKIRMLEGLISEVYTITPPEPPRFERYKWIRKRSTATSLVKELTEIKRDLRLLMGSISVVQNVQIQLSLTSIQHSTQDNNRSPVVDCDRDSFETAVQSIGTLGHDDALSKFLETVRQVGQFGTLNLQLHRIVRCDGSCSCDCHSRRFIHTPKALNSILGSLFVGYAGLPMWKRKCDVLRCMNQYTRTMQVSYSFPNWFLLRTIHMVFGMTQMNEPCFAIKVRNRTSDQGENNIFQLSRGGHKDGIIELFKNRQASPNDVTSVASYTPIHFAVELGHTETIKFLMDAGVDPYSQDDHGTSDAITISELVLAPRLRNTLAATAGFQEVFQKMKATHEEIWDFSTLHRIVLKDLHVRLEEALVDPNRREELNARDIRNRTPLIWAAMRGDVAAVKLLLNAGADVTIKDDWEIYPLSAAIISGNCPSVELLVLAGADINLRDRFGHNDLHMASWAVDDPDLLKIIVLAGASINSSNHHNESALQSCACLNHYRNGAYLIAMGVDLDSQDDNLDTPLLEAVRYEAPEMLQLLLSNGADHTLANKQDETMLHLAAMYSTSRGVEVLMAFDLVGIDVDARNKDGRTAEDMFSDRVFKPDGLEVAFNNLLMKIKSHARNVIRRVESGEEQEQEEQDVFWDAGESLPT